MTLPATGKISIGDVAVELGLTRGVALDLNTSSVRNLAGVATGKISLSNLSGKSAIPPRTIVAASDGGTGVGFASGQYGSIDDNSTPFSGLVITKLEWLGNTSGDLSLGSIWLALGTGSQAPASPLLGVTINGTVYTPQAFHDFNGLYTSWYWDNVPNPLTVGQSSPFYLTTG